MSLHADATRALTSYAPGDAHQAGLRRDFLALLDASEDAVWRSCTPDHLTVGAVVLDLDRSAVLLVLHGKVKRWLQPGGHCEPSDPTLGAAALREATEETGIAGLELVPGLVDLDRHPAPCRPGVVDHHLDVRHLLLAPPGTEPVVSEESLDVRWFGWDDLPDDIEPSIVAMITNARAHLSREGSVGD